VTDFIFSPLTASDMFPTSPLRRGKFFCDQRSN
jgi:hypothetical protein